MSALGQNVKVVELHQRPWTLRWAVGQYPLLWTELPPFPPQAQSCLSFFRWCEYCEIINMYLVLVPISGTQLLKPLKFPM